MRKPQHITFTGVDDQTSIDGMHALAGKYPIEWGILLSPKRQGVEPRYPNLQVMASLLELSRTSRGTLRFAGHLCGEHARRVNAGEDPFIEVAFSAFERFQINSNEPDVDQIALFRRRHQRSCIAQTRGPTFPEDGQIRWLFDASGGRGIRPEAWPPHPLGNQFVGYAGGIGPDNVSDVVAAIGWQPTRGPYWIDMESGVRTNDRFDLGLCEQVCKAVYG